MGKAAVYYDTQFPELPILSAKTDVDGAFRWVEVEEGDCGTMSTESPGKDFGVKGDLIDIYAVLSVGFLGSPGKTYYGRKTLNRC